MASFFRILTIAVVIAFAALLVLSFVPLQAVSTQENAAKIVFSDLDSDPVISANNHVYSLFSAEKAADGQWQVVVKVTFDPHTACPKAFIRTYQLMPIRHGIDKTITSNCIAGTPIAFPEEAILAASKTAGASSVQPLVEACGYELPIVDAKAREYCPNADLTRLHAAATAYPSSAKWLTEWAGANDRVLVALDANGNEVSSR